MELTARRIAAKPYVSKYWKQEFIDRHGGKTITYRKLDGILGKLSEALTAAFKDRDEVLKNHREAIDALWKTVDELRAAQTKTLADAFRGTWIAGTVFARGSLVTQQGGLWLCMTDSAEKPGMSDAWKLVTKAGRDGKDARP